MPASAQGLQRIARLLKNYRCDGRPGLPALVRHPSVSAEQGWLSSACGGRGRWVEIARVGKAMRSGPQTLYLATRHGADTIPQSGWYVEACVGDILVRFVAVGNESSVWSEPVHADCAERAGWRSPLQMQTCYRPSQLDGCVFRVSELNYNAGTSPCSAAGLKLQALFARSTLALWTTGLARGAAPCGSGSGHRISVC